MRELGFSNKLFYYTFVGRATFNMQLRLRFQDAVDESLLRQAVDCSIPRFPEFAMTPVCKGGCLHAKENQEQVVLRCEDYKPHAFATDDTNGYLFYLSYEGKNLRFSWFHGLTDFRGFMVLVRTILYEYALALGVSFTAEELESLKSTVRFSVPDFVGGEEDAFDPYSKYTKGISISENGDMPLWAAAIHEEQYGEQCRELNFYEIACSTSAYLKCAKELGASSASLLSALVSTATFQMKEVDGTKSVVSMLPVDLRSLFFSDTLVNFSDGIFLPMEKDDLSLSMRTRCEKIRASMKKQICPETFLPVMKAKVEQVRSIENTGAERLNIIEKNISLPEKGSFTPLTYALTYPGNLSLGPGLDHLLADASVQGFARASSIIASSFKDNFRILITYRSDNPAWPNAIFKEVQSLGLDAKMQHLGKLKGDILNPENFL